MGEWQPISGSGPQQLEFRDYTQPDVYTTLGFHPGVFHRLSPEQQLEILKSAEEFVRRIQIMVDSPEIPILTP